MYHIKRYIFKFKEDSKGKIKHLLGKDCGIEGKMFPHLYLSKGEIGHSI